MQILIDIPESIYDTIEADENISREQLAVLQMHILNGTPLPKGQWIEYTRVLIPEPINKWEQAWYCSNCGYGNQECEDGSAWLEWKHCPNCGAIIEADSEVGE